MTADEAAAVATMYAALGTIARELERAAATLEALRTGVPVAELPAAVADTAGHVARAYQAAAAARLAYA